DEKTAGLDETLEGVYERIWTMHDGEPFRALDESLGPRPPEMLLTYVEGMGLHAGARVLDVGCGRATHACKLAWHFGYSVTGVDPFESNRRAARREVEGARAFAAIGVIPENFSPARLASAFDAAGLRVASSEYIGGELLEFYEERDRRPSRELMRLAHMTRARERFIAELGPKTFDIAQALYRWTVYHLLGKIGANVYALKKDS